MIAIGDMMLEPSAKTDFTDEELRDAALNLLHCFGESALMASAILQAAAMIIAHDAYEDPSPEMQADRLLADFSADVRDQIAALVEVAASEQLAN